MFAGLFAIFDHFRKACLPGGWRTNRCALVPLCGFVFAACSMNPDSLESFLAASVRARPEMEVQDLYKLLYQGHFGIGHLIASRDAASEYLFREMGAISAQPPNPLIPASAEAQPPDPLLESCSPDGKMVRVNLRPFGRLFLDPEKLLDAMMETARLTAADTASFRAEWEKVGIFIRKGALHFETAAYDALSRDMREAGFPAVHHSQKYSQRYHPAYRVVLREQFVRCFPDAGK